MLLIEDTKRPQEEQEKRMFRFGRRTLDKPLDHNRMIIAEGYAKTWNIPQDIVEIAFIAGGMNLKYRHRLLETMWPYRSIGFH